MHVHNKSSQLECHSDNYGMIKLSDGMLLIAMDVYIMIVKVVGY